MIVKIMIVKAGIKGKTTFVKKFGDKQCSKNVPSTHSDSCNACNKLDGSQPHPWKGCIQKLIHIWVLSFTLHLISELELVTLW